MVHAAQAAAILGALASRTPVTDRPVWTGEGAITQALERAVAEILVKYADLTPEQLALCSIRLDRADGRHVIGAVRGDQPFYPASVVKLFYLAYGAQLLDRRAFTLTPEVERAFTDMIVESSNDATHAVMDVMTGTTGGPEMPEAEFAAWSERRHAVNRWLRSRGYEGVNACQKTWCEGPYGRERQFVLAAGRNSLTAASSARMMAEVALGTVASAQRTAWMHAKLERAIPAEGEADDQARMYIGKSVPKGAQLWSKAGHVDSERHDVAWVRFPSGQEWVLAIFTKEHGGREELIPEVASTVWRMLGQPVAEMNAKD